MQIWAAGLVVLLGVACEGMTVARTFEYVSQERSVYAQVSNVSAQRSASDFAPWVNVIATAILGNRGADSLQSSAFGSNELSFSGSVDTTTSGAGLTNAKGVFDVMFTLTAATHVEFFWFTEANWNLTLWTPTTTRILATAAQSGKNANESLFFEAGTYRLRADSDVSNGAAGNAAYVLAIVPAPTSLAVLGAVGLLAARRRR